MTRDWRGRELRCPAPRAYPYRSDGRDIYYQRCRRSTCVACAPQRVLGIVNAIAHQPLCQSGYATLEEVPDDLREAGKTLRQATSRALRYAATGAAVPWLTVVELSPSGRPHLHVITREPAISPRAFRDGCRRAGLGVVSIEEVRRPRRLARYIYKTILPEFGTPLIADPVALGLFLECNGGRLIHTRGFWRDSDGGVLPDARTATQVASRHALTRPGARTEQRGRPTTLQRPAEAAHEDMDERTGGSAA